MNVLDLRKGGDQSWKFSKGELYQKGRLVQVWWNHDTLPAQEESIFCTSRTAAQAKYQYYRTIWTPLALKPSNS